MGLIAFLLFGLIVGLLARALMPGRQHMGLLATTLLGVVGSFVGGLLGSLFFGSRVVELRSSGLVGSVIGALVVLGVAGWAAGSRRRAFS